MANETERPDAPKSLVARLGLATPSKPWAVAAVAGLGGFITIYLLAALGSASGILLLIPPFGASCVLVFGLPQSPLAQPRSVIGGHFVSAAAGLLAFVLLGATPLAFGVGVGLAISAMMLTGTTHPPAGANPIVVILAGASWPFLFVPVFVGALAIVGVGVVFHRYGLGRAYPTRS